MEERGDFILDRLGVARMLQMGGLITEIHGFDKTALHGEYVENLAARKNFPFKTLDELVHPDALEMN